MRNCLSYIAGVLFALVGLSTNVNASAVSHKMDSTVIEKFSIYYMCDSTEVNPYYLDNPKRLSRIINYINNSPRIDSIVINAYASPEGHYNYNRRLSIERAETAKRLLLAYSRDSLKLNSSKIVIHQCDENWGGLTDSILSSYDKSDRDEVVSILLDKSISDNTRKQRLQAIDRGRTWRYIIDNYMAVLRTAEWTFYCAEIIELPKLPEIKGTLVYGEQPFVIKQKAAPAEPVEPEDKKKSFYINVSTNLLYDAVTALNFSVEIPFNDKFSILYEHHCPWWLSKSNKYCLQFLSFGGEFRWWFAPWTKKESAKRIQRDVLTGHFLGVYGWTGKSDIQIDNRLGCYQFEFCSAGLTYGYSMPISKYLNMEFSISAGYAQIPYRHYIPTEDWALLIRDDNKAGTLHYFGPTKAEISLVIPIRANFKGGRKK